MKNNRFYVLYWKLQSKIVPNLKYSQYIYEEVLNDHCSEYDTWLDLGCGHAVLPYWRLEEEKKLIKSVKMVVGIDYDYYSLRKHKTIKNKLRADITNLPFKDNTFDIISSNMVFEHLENPALQLKEISRILKKGGKLIFHTPNTLSYATFLAKIVPECIKERLIYFLQGRKEDDVFPTYYRINAPSKIRIASKSAGLNVVKIKLICSSAQLIMFPPLVLLELFFIKFLMSQAGKKFRTNIITICEKL